MLCAFCSLIFVIYYLLLISVVTVYLENHAIFLAAQRARGDPELLLGAFDVGDAVVLCFVDPSEESEKVSEHFLTSNVFLKS